MTVPAAWDRADASGGWQPPNADGEFPALSVGTARTGPEEGAARGSSSRCCRAPSCPSRCPSTPSAGPLDGPIDDSQDGERLAHRRLLRLPGRGVIVERVVQVAANTLLWVQVRSDDRATANQVLDDVETHGI